MPDRAALVTGASSDIGLAIAHMLGEEGHGLTVAARRPQKLQAAAQELRDAGYDVEEVPASLTEEDEVRDVVERHRERFGRMDVLVNKAGVGVGAPVAEILTKRLDMHPVHPRAGQGRGHDPADRHRRERALPSAPLRHVRRARDRLPAPGRAGLIRTVVFV
jgi:NAD(P)-dependent dehydrogenase (short-subunit alcohol dehydrogenase family)